MLWLKKKTSYKWCAYSNRRTKVFSGAAFPDWSGLVGVIKVYISVQPWINFVLSDKSLWRVKRPFGFLIAYNTLRVFLRRRGYFRWLLPLSPPSSSTLQPLREIALPVCARGRWTVPFSITFSYLSTSSPPQLTQLPATVITYCFIAGPQLLRHRPLFAGTAVIHTRLFVGERISSYRHAASRRQNFGETYCTLRRQKYWIKNNFCRAFYWSHTHNRIWLYKQFFYNILSVFKVD